MLDPFDRDPVPSAPARPDIAPSTDSGVTVARAVRLSARPFPSKVSHRAPCRPRDGPVLPTVALTVVALTWGISFSVVDRTADVLPSADLVAWRFGGATFLLALVARTARPLPASLRLRSCALGALLGLGFLLQAWAMTDTDAMMSGFLTGTLVVFAPLINWARFRDRPSHATWAAVAIAAVGLALLSVRGAGFGAGEGLTLLAALVWALHLVLLSRWARAEHALAIARIQTGTVAVMALATVAVCGAFDGGALLPSAPGDGGTWLAIGFLAVGATAGAMVLLTWAQARMSAVRVAIVLTLEPAAAAVTAGLLGGELGGRTILGGLLLVGAMLVVEVGSRRVVPSRSRRLRARLHRRRHLMPLAHLSRCRHRP